MTIGEQITIPCNVGDKFYIIAYTDPRPVYVECIGYDINVDVIRHINERCVWVASIDNPRDYWKIPFHEFEDQCFTTKENAEMALSCIKE